jgi:ketosteroid isomerase-like protein
VGKASGSRECARWRAHHHAEIKDGGHGASAPLPTLRRKSIEMSHNKRELIRALFAAYMSNDRVSVENSFTEDFRFTSPYDDAIDKATYFERCWRVSDWIERQQLEKIFVEDDEAFVTYDVVTKEGKRFRNTEFFRFDGDKIRSIDVYFGATYQDGAFVKQEG